MLQQQQAFDTEHNASDYLQSGTGNLPSPQETLGMVVTEIIRAGNTVNRTAICAKLVAKLELVVGSEMEKQYHDLIALVLGRE